MSASPQNQPLLQYSDEDCRNFIDAWCPTPVRAYITRLAAGEAANSAVAPDLFERIEHAINRVTHGEAAMRVPADNTDPDLVLAECRDVLTTLARQQAAAVALDPQLANFYQVDSVPALLAAMEEHIERLQESARRNVKPWEDTFPPTLLPKYLRDNGLPETPATTAVVHVHTTTPGARHKWDDTGERCVECGDKDWMGGPCNATPPAASGDSYVRLYHAANRMLAEMVNEGSIDRRAPSALAMMEALRAIDGGRYDTRLAAVAPAGMATAEQEQPR